MNHFMMSNQILMALAKIKMANIHCNTFVFIRFPVATPNGEPMMLAMTMTIAGMKST